MKRKTLILVLSVFVACPFFMNSCQSPEVTSAKVYFQQNNLDDAEEQLLIALQKEPLNPEVPFLLATGVYIPKKEWLKARDQLLKVKEIDPTYTNPMTKTNADEQLKRLWGEIHTQGANKFNAALKAILPSEKDSLLKAAVQNFKMAIDIRPEEIISYNGIVKCYYILNDTLNIVNWAEIMMDNGLFDQDVYTYYIQILWAQDQKDEAIGKLNQILTDHADAMKLQDLRVLYLAQLKRYDEAKEIAKKLIQDNPDNIDLKYLLAQVHMLTGDFESAQYIFKQVLIENPDDIEVMVQAVEAAFQAKDWISAEDFARRVIELDPENIHGYTLLWKSLYNQGNKEEAEKYRQIEKSLR